MNDIYKQKAKKYKYKYLKLKNDYIGGVIDSSWLSWLSNRTTYFNFEYIGSGGYGCIISPPFQFNIQNDNKDNILYPPEKIISDDIYKDIKYVGKLLSCDKGSFQTEINEFLKINKIDPEAQHRSQLIFAAYYNRKELTKKLTKRFYNGKQIRKLWDCLNEKNLFKEEKNPDNQPYIKDLKNPCNENDNYGYIISTKVGTSFDKIDLGKFNKDEIITILTNLKESIKDLIVKLYDDGSIHGDLKLANMTLDNNYKVSFIDFGFVTKINEIINITNASGNHQCSDIIYIFMKIIDNFSPFFNINNMTSLDLINKINSINQPIRKSELIELINKSENEKKNTILPQLLSSTTLSFIDYSCFFQSLEDEKEYFLIDFYTLCIEPIIKNIDIYALSLFIHQLFFSIWFKTFNLKYINKDTYIILNALLINALYNNIDGPSELIIYLDGIIDSLNNSYVSKTITNKIINLRGKKKQFFYYDINGYLKNQEEKLIPYVLYNKK
jgi:hypothetical protein